MPLKKSSKQSQIATITNYDYSLESLHQVKITELNQEIDALKHMLMIQESHFKKLKWTSEYKKLRNQINDISVTLKAQLATYASELESSKLPFSMKGKAEYLHLLSNYKMTLKYLIECFVLGEIDFDNTKKLHQLTASFALIGPIINYYLCSTAQTSQADLKAKLLQLLAQDCSSLLHFNAPDFILKTSISAQFSTKPQIRDCLFDERQQLSTGLKNKTTLMNHVLELISSHQQKMKQVLGVLLEACTNKSVVYHALHDNPADMHFLKRIQDTLQYDFNNLDQPASAYQMRLQDLLSYDYHDSDPYNTKVFIRLQELKNKFSIQKLKFYEQFPALIIQEESFHFADVSHPFFEEMSTDIQAYISARNHFINALEYGEKQLTNGKPILFIQELSLLKQSVERIKSRIEIQATCQRKLQVLIKEIDYFISRNPSITDREFYGDFKNTLLGELVNNKPVNHQLIVSREQQFRQLKQNSINNLKRHSLIEAISKQKNLILQKSAILQTINQNIDFHLKSLTDHKKPDPLTIELLQRIKTLFLEHQYHADLFKQKLHQRFEHPHNATFDVLESELKHFKAENTRFTLKLIEDVKFEFETNISQVRYHSAFSNLAAWIDRFILKFLAKLTSNTEHPKLGLFANGIKRNFVGLSDIVSKELEILKKTESAAPAA